jgi:hypothetical protein
VYLRTFFSLLITTIVLTIAGYFLVVKVIFGQKIPLTPCTRVVSDGKFINDNYKRSQFNGVVTLWLKNNMITVFGVYETNEGKKKLTRNLLLDHVKTEGNIVTGTVKSINISPSDQVDDNGNFFSAKDERLNIHFKKIKKGEYLVMINNNWISSCKEN